MRGFSVTMMLKGNFPSEKVTTQFSVTYVLTFDFKETRLNPHRYENSVINGIVIIKSLA